MRTMQEGRPGDRQLVRDAIDCLRQARDMLVASRSPRAAAAVRRALSSAEGAARHAAHRERRMQAPGDEDRRNALGPSG